MKDKDEKTRRNNNKRKNRRDRGQAKRDSCSGGIIMYAIVVDLNFHIEEKDYFGYELIKLNGARPKIGVHLIMNDYFGKRTVTREKGKTYVNPDYSEILDIVNWKPVPEEDYEILKGYMKPHEITDKMIEEETVEEL